MALYLAKVGIALFSEGWLGVVRCVFHCVINSCCEKKLPSGENASTKNRHRSCLKNSGKSSQQYIKNLDQLARSVFYF
jgi:hypothetical protein